MAGTVDEPGYVAPMLAVAGPVPSGPGWAGEIKWDGIRLVTAVGRERTRCWTRAGREVSGTWPEVSRVRLAGLAGRTAVLDGEVVALGVDGRPSFGQLQQRMGRSSPADVARAAGRIPVAYLVFDLTVLDGRDLTGLRWSERRQLLENLDLAPWQVPSSSPDPVGLFAFAAAQGLEGIVAKRTGSTYHSGARSPEWVKAKHLRTQEVVVGGWLPGREGRTGDLGALLTGIPDPAGGCGEVRLRFVGRVGTGWTTAGRRGLLERLRGLAAPASPFTGPVGAPAAVWVGPTLVGEVAYAEVTASRLLRHPVWRGLRPDKTPGEVVEE